MQRKSFKYFIIRILAAGIFSIFLVNISRADDPGFPENPDYDPDTEVPIDGGTGILLLAGAVYGIKKIREDRRN